MGKLPRVKIPQVPGTEIADPTLRGVVAAVRETLQTRGHGKERWITMADLEEKGLINVDNNGTITVPKTAVAPPSSAAGGEVIPCMPPPPPTGVEAEGIFTMVMLTWDAPPYPYSARHAFTEVWRAQQDNVGVASVVGTTQSTVYSDVVGPGGGQWFYWTRHVNECGGIGPFNSVSGTLAETLPDNQYILDLLAGQITEEQLYIDLNKRIDLVDGNAAMPGSVDQRITHTETMFQNETDRLSQEISLLTTGVSGSLDPYQSWYFDGDADGWLAGGVAAPWVSGWAGVTGTDALTLPADFAPEINGAQYMVVVIRVTRLAGTGWKGRVRYKTAAHDFSDDYFVDILDPSIAPPAVAGDLNRENAQTLYWDMSTLTAPSLVADDWLSSNILAIELQLGDDPGDEFALDYITIGRFGPGASVASVYEESTARITADQALAVQITNLRGQYEGNLATINAQLSALATTDQSLAAAITTLQASFVSEVGRLDARVNTEQTARASADSALASQVTTLSTTVSGHTAAIQQNISSINGLSAEYAVRLDIGGRVSGFGIYGGPTSSKFYVNADQFAIVGPNSGLNTAKVPFVVQTSDQVIGGVLIKAGTYIQSAFIVDAAITTAKIKDLAVEVGKIADLAVTTAKIGDGQITIAKIEQTIQSTNWDGSHGWMIDKNGLATFMQVTVKGHIEATSGSFSGTINALNGVFGGTLSAVDGTFNTLTLTPDGTSPGWLKSTGMTWNGGATEKASGRGFVLGKRGSGSGTSYLFIGSSADGGKSIEYDEGTGDFKMNGEIVGKENLPVKEITNFVGGVESATNNGAGRPSLVQGGRLAGGTEAGIIVPMGAKYYPKFPNKFFGQDGVLVVTTVPSPGASAADLAVEPMCIIATASAMGRAFSDNGNIVVGIEYYNYGNDTWVPFASSGGSANTNGDVNVSVTGRFAVKSTGGDNQVEVRMWVQANGATGSTLIRMDNLSLVLMSSMR